MGQQELNLRSPAYETGALPLSYDPMAPALGVEPTGWSFGGSAAAEARRQLEKVSTPPAAKRCRRKWVPLIRLGVDEEVTVESLDRMQPLLCVYRHGALLFSWCQGRDSNSRRQELHPCALPLSYLGIGTERGIRTHKKTDLSRSRLPITPSRHIDFLVGTVGLEPTLNWF